jgi:threonine synthase
MTATAPLRCADGHPGHERLDWRCRCGRPWEYDALPVFDAAAIETSTWSMWRYAAMLPMPVGVTLGEGGTPLVDVELPEGRFRAKLEFLAPTGSYKDRGTAAYVGEMRVAGAGLAVADSSGNAGASLAAYTAAAGVKARIYVPEGTSAVKLGQISAVGAEFVTVAGSRSEVGEACRRDPAGIYSGHSWHPAYLCGQLTCAWEIWEQCGVPTAIVCPVGQGGLFLGLARGFAALLAAGIVGRVPRMFAAQASACAPVAAAFSAGRSDPEPVSPRPSVAEGLRTVAPVRGAEVLAVIRATNGGVVAVDEPAIEAAHRHLADAGLLVEPTSAVAVAALGCLRLGEDTVVPLTGSGLKALAALADC